MGAVRTGTLPQTAAGGVLTRVTALYWLLAIAAVVRLMFIGSDGFHNDVAAFESWALTLKDNWPWQFYAKTSFADYPPGYFVVEFVLGRVYGLLQALHVASGDPGYAALRALVKLPAIAMDLVDAAIVWAIVKRYAPGAALFVAALFAFNPAAIYESAYWGQVDSVSWGFVLLALWLVLRAHDAGEPVVTRLVQAWLAFGFSILIKPQAALVAAVLVAFAFATDDPAVRALRVRGTAYGIAAAAGLGIVVALLFHPAPDVIGWLYHQYTFGKDVYPFNSVNAFNLYAIRQVFWQDDRTPMFLPFITLATWGIVLVLGATALIVGRYVQRKDERAFLEAAMLVALAFFILSTRMHERYIYGAFLLAMPLVVFGRVWLLAGIGLSLTTLLNLAYSFAYQTVMETKPAGVDARDVWPLVSHPASLLNVVIFFGLGYVFLGGLGSAATAPGSAGVAPAAGARDDGPAFDVVGRVRAWFSPFEGIRRMTPLDHGIAAALALASFVVCVLFIQWPTEKIFDEIYYPRAGEEYLKGIEGSNVGYGVFEFTHPPLTKLIITLSMMLFGGLHGLGDTAVGWRFLSVVCGAAMVYLIYAFAKRLTGSTVGATLAGGMLLLDGFHFTQSRISTPEIFVATFSLLVIYAFYRYVIAAQVALHPSRPRAPVRRASFVAMGIGAFVALVLAIVLPRIGPAPYLGASDEWMWKTETVVFLYVLIVAWLVTRLVVQPRAAAASRVDTSYPDGTRVVPEGNGTRIVPLDAPSTKPSKPVTIGFGEAERRFEKDGTLTYTTPDGSAVYRADGTAQTADVTSPARDAWVWFWVLAISSALLAASKWNGLVDWLLVWGALAVVAGQRWLSRPAAFGNPFGMAPDLVLSGMIAVGGAVYLACYTPFFVQNHHDLRDLVSLQHAMYQYHHDLKATHPYQSQWWQWPIIGRPISYYYHDFRVGAAAQQAGACCVAEILALPNPLIWWAGILSIPLVGILAWTEKNKGYALLVGAYVLQWLPWIASPRIAFEYHFFPNLAIIVLANAIVLERIWRLSTARWGIPAWSPRAFVGLFALASIALFVFFYPILAGVHITWSDWHARMWTDRWI